MKKPENCVFDDCFVGGIRFQISMTLQWWKIRCTKCRPFALVAEFLPCKKCCSGINTDQGHPCPISPYPCQRCHQSNCLTSAVASRVSSPAKQLLKLGTIIG